ncbi:helix-turn-helix transcriptional regulator [Streptomyces prunicolor]|uniref:Helix-turn-helix transcriptional regulator n=1 Tax=Streptomyces prunicolor TaxID=67348 RepID=A0ABU4FKB7_9ACTN|nr:helix-turn-helix transcriptional regulator [Streptomyces prunicolor]MDV7220433.1 helix-turn-helix transcriptional regulator [Streptomyces prunicolor]
MGVLMAGRVRGGRPWGPIRAESKEAKDLAEFLRDQVDASGKTLAQLAEQIHVSKSQISVGLAGKVPEPAFVTALIRAAVPEPHLREKRLAHARLLLHAATHPSPASPLPPAASEVELAHLRAQQVETYDRLTRSLEAQNQLHEAAGNSAKLVMVLLTMINRLEQRITDLTGERDQLRAAHVDTDTLHQTQQKLARAQEQEQRAQQELLRTQEKQRQAETLAATVQAQVAQLTDELDRLRNTSTTSADTNGTENTVAPFTPSDGTTTDPVGDDFDQALTRITAVNDHDGQLLQDITHNLQQNPGEDENTVAWWVVTVQDNPPASPDTADNLSTGQIGRPQKEIVLDGSPARLFAYRLRDLRASAGLTLDQLARRTGYGRTTVGAAMRGKGLATRPVTLAIVAACGGDIHRWGGYWMQVRRAMDPDSPYGLDGIVPPPWDSPADRTGRAHT